MNKILKWFVEPYSTTLVEMNYLANLNKNTVERKERTRIRELQAFNVMFLMLISVLFLLSIFHLFLIFFSGWYAFAPLFVSVIMITLAKIVQKKRYFKRRDAYIKNDPGLIKND
ncbi:hypothetical protein KDJ21_005630 [Metabacillus litoralis]|uniref:hypothetical protein n=1 Tax=Metabacillus litoralis TaxID=152268 RepID=UPI001BA305BB|nr:hypothetical protein [Metabacillus litoralis]UHA61145.1 hypothetical protein KDJ21_005630 [Metabacillus litoralis]